MTLQKVLKQVDKELNEKQPKTMDELINIVHSVDGVGNYGSSFSIVYYMGYLQGIRVYITGRKVSHCLPGTDKVYSVFNGVERYERAEWKVEHETN